MLWAWKVTCVSQKWRPPNERQTWNYEMKSARLCVSMKHLRSSRGTEGPGSEQLCQGCVYSNPEIEDEKSDMICGGLLRRLAKCQLPPAEPMCYWHLSAELIQTDNCHPQWVQVSTKHQSIRSLYESTQAAITKIARPSVLNSRSGSSHNSGD